MKKTYEAPSIEKIAFQYRDQVVVASGTNCKEHYEHTGHGSCPEDEQVLVKPLS